MRKGDGVVAADRLSLTLLKYRVKWARHRHRFRCSGFFGVPVGLWRTHAAIWQ